METPEQIPRNEKDVLAELDAIIKSKIKEKGFEVIHHKIIGFINALISAEICTKKELEDTKVNHILSHSGEKDLGEHKFDIEGGLLERFLREEL